MRLSRRELTTAAGLILAFAVPLTATLLLTGSEPAVSKPQAKAASVGDASAGAADQHR